MTDIALAAPPAVIATPPARAALIAVSHLGKSFGRHIALDDVDLTLAEGECIGLVGHNGAGKSTLIKLMLGLFRPTSGSVCVLGADPAGSAAAPSRVALGYLPENVAFQPSMTGIETLVVLRAPEAPIGARGSGAAGPRRACRGRPPPRRHLLQGHVPAARSRPGTPRATRARCCWMSRRADWIRRHGRISTQSCADCATTARAS